MSIVEDWLQDTIRELIHDLLKCFDDSEWEVRDAAVEALCGLAMHGMCHRASCVDILSIV